MDDDDVLRISHSFPFPASANDNDGSALRGKANQKYAQDMISLLEEVGADPNPVGWYVSANLGRFFSQNVIDNMLSFQVQNPESVVLVYDLTRTVHASFSLRAYRLSAAYLASKKEGKFSSESLVRNELSYSTIFDELPVEIHNSHMITLYLQTLQPSKEFNNLKITVDPYLESNIESIFESVDEFHYDQGNYNYYQRQLAREKVKILQWQQKRKAENSNREAAGKQPLSTEEWKDLFKLPEEPSRLDNLLISGQINQYCSQIEEFAAAASSKMFGTQKTLLEN
jgi:translation initiation factor 3 subunit H